MLVFFLRINIIRCVISFRFTFSKSSMFKNKTNRHKSRFHFKLMVCCNAFTSEEGPTKRLKRPGSITGWSIEPMIWKSSGCKSNVTCTVSPFFIATRLKCFNCLTGCTTDAVSGVRYSCATSSPSRLPVLVRSKLSVYRRSPILFTWRLS